MPKNQRCKGGRVYDQTALLQKAKLRIEEAAVLLEVTPRTVQRYLVEGKLEPVILPGGHRRVRTDSLRKYL